VENVTAPLDPDQIPPFDPIHLSREAMRARLPKRFYEEAAVVERDGGFHVALDGRTARTPGRNRLVLPTRAAAEAVAVEWAAQGERIDPAAMPATRLVNSALDGVAADPASARAEIVSHASSDLLCYRAGEPEKLVARQSDLWDPVLAWANAELGARFFVVQGISFVAQPRLSLAAVTRAVEAVPAPFALAALNLMTVLSGSALIALAVAHGSLEPDAAWAAAHVDEDVQIETWGEDAEAAVRRARRFADFAAAAELLRRVGFGREA
jgi:chaperone required for assembly of F1-ATPase